MCVVSFFTITFILLKASDWDVNILTFTGRMSIEPLQAANQTVLILPNIFISRSFIFYSYQLQYQGRGLLLYVL